MSYHLPLRQLMFFHNIPPNPTQHTHTDTHTCNRAHVDVAMFQRGAADVNREALWRSKVLASLVAPPSLPAHKSASRKPAVGLGEGRRWYSISGLWITAPCSVFFLWWFGWLSSWQDAHRRNVFWSWPQLWRTDWETGIGGLLGYCVAPGVLI